MAKAKAAKKVVKKAVRKKASKEAETTEEVPVENIPTPQEDTEKVMTESEATEEHERFSSGLTPEQRSAREKLAGGGLLLAYLFGEEGGYLLVVGPREARLVKIELDAAAAKALGVDAGPLTAARLKAALANEQNDTTVGLQGDHQAPR